MEHNSQNKLINNHRIIKNNFIEIILFFAILFLEIILKISQQLEINLLFFLYIIFNSLIITSFVSILFNLIKNINIKHIILYIVLILFMIITATEICINNTFSTFYSIFYIFKMTDSVVHNFSDMMMQTIVKNLHYIVLTTLPIIFIIVFNKKIYKALKRNYKHKKRIIYNIFVMTISFIIITVCTNTISKDIYKINYNTNNSIIEFGLFKTLSLETKYKIFGYPDGEEENQLLYNDIEEDLDQNEKNDDYEKYNDNNNVDKDENNSLEEKISTNSKIVNYLKDENKIYNSEEYNVLNIDFDYIDQTARKKKIREINEIVRNLTPTKKNKWTGYFKDKMLIQIVAEAFSPYIIDEELTPTLYKMSNSGFVCNYFYMPELAQSTTGGEFVALFGLVPTVMNDMNSMLQSSLDYLPFSLAHQFKNKGYNCFAYHPTYKYYDRNLTHPALGYDFRATNNGLPVVTNRERTVFFDSVMAEITVDDYIKPYKEKGQKFHAYYMTYSGHGPYTDKNPRSMYHYDKVNEKYPDYSEPVKYYIASQLELEYMVSYIVKKLEENDMLNDVVFCITADHYPYVLSKLDDKYHHELSKKVDTEYDASRFESKMILWSNDMKEVVNIDEPCSPIDVLPTLSNLFGLKYDSRLFVGRDILSDNYNDYYVSNNMPMVMIHRGNTKKISFVTKVSYYDAYKNIFKKEKEVEEDYLTKMKNLCILKYDLSRDIIFFDYYKYIKTFLRD